MGNDTIMLIYRSQLLLLQFLGAINMERGQILFRGGYSLFQGKLAPVVN